MGTMSALEQFMLGTYEGFAVIPDEVYNADRHYFRNSWQSSLMVSPAHCLHAMLHPRTSVAFEFGRALHYAILEPEVFDFQVMVKPEWDARTREGKILRDEFLEKAKGKTVISASEFEDIQKISFQIAGASECRALLREGRGVPEHVMCWQDPETGVMCKAKMDMDRLDIGAIVDLKTCESAQFKPFQRSIAAWGYGRQAAMYLHGASVLSGKLIQDFVFLAIEKSAPHEFGMYRLDEASIDKSFEEYQTNLRTFKQCRDTNVWPGYAREIVDINLPSWAWNDKY